MFQAIGSTGAFSAGSALTEGLIGNNTRRSSKDRRYIKDIGITEFDKRFHESRIFNDGGKSLSETAARTIELMQQQKGSEGDDTLPAFPC